MESAVVVLNGDEKSTRLNNSADNLFFNDRPFVSVTDRHLISTTIEIIFDQWSLTLPEIIISFISGAQPYTSWQKEDHRTALQRGVTKLVKATETWILDSGLDYDLSKAIGDAMRTEQHLRKSKNVQEAFENRHLLRPASDIVVIGIVSAVGRSSMRFNVDPKHERDLDSSHTHFIFLEERATLLRYAIEDELARQAGIRRVNWTEAHSDGTSSVALQKHEQVPLVAVFVQGGYAELEQIYGYLKNGIPVIVVTGTGYVADIFVYAFEEYKDRGGAQTELNVLKSTVLKRMSRVFPDSDSQSMCDKIMDCLQLSHQNDKWLLRSVQSGEDLGNLDDHVLSAVFAVRSECLVASKEQIRSEVLLTMKLNKPDQLPKILNRNQERLFQTDNELFEESLLWKGRERFVERFLEEDFPVHKFLSHSQLLALFRAAEDRGFFITVVWDHIPSHYVSDGQIDESFVTRDLNLVIEKLTGISNFISMYGLSANFLGTGDQKKQTAERKAKNALMVWAVLMNRFELVKTLWKFCDDPIVVALFVSSLYRGLKRHCFDPAIANGLKANSKAFSMMAIDVLDLSYQEVSAYTFDLLNQEFPDFNNKTTVKLAYFSGNKYFLSHEACQIWLNHLWDGDIEIASQWSSHIPEDIKLVFSATLLFPILFWIRFPKRKFTPRVKGSQLAVSGGNFSTGDFKGPQQHFHEDDEFHIAPQEKELAQSYIQKLQELKKFESSHTEQRFRKRSEKALLRSTPSNTYHYRKLPFWRQIGYLWGAPRTKFWMSQVFYWFYLGVFSLATILPSCSAAKLDILILIWTLLNLVEISLRTNFQAKHDFPINRITRVMEIIFIGSFVLGLAVHIAYLGAERPFHFRAFMAIGLLYMYYRMVAVFFPMHHILGPMLYRIRRMLTVDFLSFFKLTLPFILANMFVLQAVMYPDLPFGQETFRKGFYRSFFALFVSLASEIDRTAKCEETLLTNVTDVCWTGDYANYMCPTLGWTTYILNIQYWIIMRLIFLTLLNALFAATMIKATEDADYIFKYQRYRTVLDFALRPALPPPLSIFNYVFDWIIFCYAKLKHTDQPNQQLLMDSGALEIITKPRQQHPYLATYSYWKAMTKEYFRRKTHVDREKAIAKEQFAKIKTLVREQKNVQNNLARLSDQISEMGTRIGHPH